MLCARVAQAAEGEARLRGMFDEKVYFICFMIVRGAGNIVRCAGQWTTQCESMQHCARYARKIYKGPFI